MGSPTLSSARSLPSLRMSSLRFLLPLLLLLVCIHYLFSSSTSYSSLSLSTWASSSGDLSTDQLLDILADRVSSSNLSLLLNGLPAHTPAPRRTANAAIVMLARNSELNDVASSMRQFEDRFNSKYNYPWVFLNDEPFTEQFIQ